MLISDTTIDGTKVSDLSPSSEKKVKTKCNTCGKISTTTYGNYRRSQDNRDNPGTTYCRGCAALVSASKRKGMPAHNKGKRLPPEQKGENHPSWKGGKYVDNHGYILVYVGKTGDVGWNSYKKEHTLVMEKLLGRCIDKNELIHHIDGDKQNNEQSNLWLTNSKGHKEAHQSLQELGYEMIRTGVIVFDRDKGKYFWSSEHVGCDEQRARKNH